MVANGEWLDVAFIAPSSGSVTNIQKSIAPGHPPAGPATPGPGQAPQVPQVIINLPGPAAAPHDRVSDLLNATAGVLWPMVALFALVLFRGQIISLAKRIRKGRAFGAEAEFDKEELEALNREVRKASEESQSAVPATSAEQDGTAIQSTQADDVRATILAEATRSPRIGLMLLSAEIDKVARRIAAASGQRERSSVREQILIWASVLPSHTASALQLFSRVRNRIVHGLSASEQEILSAIDSGLTLYSALEAIPIEQNVVIHPGVDIYGDPDASKLLEGKGVIMKTTHAGKETMRIFPSTQTHFRPGMKLTWEWNMGRVWGEAWYREPETGMIKPAWNSSAEFIGRDLDLV